MARRTLPFAAALAVLTLPAVPAMAGGGGCHAEATEGAGDTVEMLEACFTPTTLRIAPGDTVAFVNRDPITHNVVANGWGHPDDMGKGDAFTATFTEPGVYPYACGYHWGMTAAVVVGDGVGNGQQVRVASFEPPSPVVEVRTVRIEAGSSPVAWLVAGSIGLALGAALGIAVTRRRREPVAES